MVEVEQPVECGCGVEMELRAEGTETATPVVAETVEFRGYVCPACGDGRRFEYDDEAEEWCTASG